MKLTLDNVKAYAIENGYTDLYRCNSGKGYYLITSFETITYFFTLKNVLQGIKDGLPLQSSTMTLDETVTGLHESIYKEFESNEMLNKLDFESLRVYLAVLNRIDIEKCCNFSKKKWTEFNRLERLKRYCSDRMFLIL